VIVTGPNRDIFKGTSFKFIYASPGGNTMMTGKMELVKAAQYRFGEIANRTCLRQAGIEKSKIASLHPPPFGDCVVMARRGKRASFRSFSIAIILRLWVTVLTV
jgi:hypothetical protein